MLLNNIRLESMVCMFFCRGRRRRRFIANTAGDDRTRKRRRSDADTLTASEDEIPVVK